MGKDPGVGHEWGKVNTTRVERIGGEWSEGRLEKQAGAGPGRELWATARILVFILTVVGGNQRC